MHQIQIQRRHIGSSRIARQRVVKGVTRTENRRIARVRRRYRADRRVPAIVAFGVIVAPRTGFRDRYGVLFRSRLVERLLGVCTCCSEKRRSDGNGQQGNAPLYSSVHFRFSFSGQEMKH